MKQLEINVFKKNGYVLRTVYHFDLNISKEDEAMIRSMHHKKLPNIKVAARVFPKTEKDCPEGMDLERMHILIDAAHLVEYAIKEYEELQDPNLLEMRREYLLSAFTTGMMSIF